MTDNTRENTGPVPLHFCFPVAKNEGGGEFAHCEEFLNHLGNSEAGGFWPIGRNGLWHGAIHITHASAPWCALSSPSTAEQESHPVPFTGGQPLRNMADGEVIAYRVCSDLKEARWWGNPVPHACSFVLIRHYVQPGETKQSGLTFYTLYMNLAPWSAYSNDNAHNWTVNWPSGLKSFADKYRAWRTGTLPRGTKISWDNTDPTLRSEDGGTVMGRVTLRQNVHTSDMELQAGDKVWVSVRDAANLKPEFGGAKRPVWWETLLPPHQHTLELDEVVCPDPIPIKAGDAIGHLGYLGHQSNSRFSMKHEGQYQVHIECFTADDNLAHFLTNPEQVGIDKPAWLKFIPGVTAYEYSGWPMKFEPRKEPSTLDAVQRLRDEARSAKDGFTGQLYWCSGQKMDWIRDEDTKKLSRYDLVGQGFELVDIPTTGFKYLGENRSRKGFIRKLMEVLHFASKQEQRTKYGAMEYEYERFLRDIDADKKYDRHQILSWLYVPMLRHSLNRLIIRHISAWAYASHAMWEEEHLSDYRKNEPGEAEYWDTVLKNEVWMPELDKSKVNLPAELWHMHPIVFLDAISERLLDVIEFQTTLGIYRISKQSADFILSWEAYSAKPYVPAGDNTSGVTVGYGYDLGQHTISSARTVLSEYYSASQVERLLFAVGKKGAQAKNIVSSLSDIVIAKDSALKMAMSLKQTYSQQVVDIYPEAIKLQPDSAGALLSLIYNRGNSLANGDRRKEMREIQDDFKNNAIEKIPSRLRSMKRLWPDQRGLRDRREGEAKFIENEYKGGL